MKKTGLMGYRKNFIKFLSIFMVIFPWITYLRVAQYTEAEKSIFGGYNGLLIDFFIYYKEIVLIIVAVVSMLWFVGERFLPQKVDNDVPLFKGKNKWLFILAAIFAIGTIISTVVSQYQKNALWGSPTVGEGLWTLLAYIVIVLMFYNYFANDFGMSMLKKVISILSGITVVLTVIEWFYKPLLEIGLVQALAAPAKYAEIVSSMKASVFDSAISLTFYNPGYYGGFVCILLPFAVMFCLQAKKMAEKILHGVLLVGLLFGIVASNTTTALYIAILEVILVLAVYVVSDCAATRTGSRKCSLLQSGSLLVTAAVALILSGVITGNSFLNIFTNANSATEHVTEERFEIQDIQLKQNGVLLVSEDASLKIVYDKNKMLFFDEEGKELSPIYEGNDVTFEESEYAHLSISFRKASEEMQPVFMRMLIDAGYQDTIDFFLLEDGVFTGVGQGNAILTDIGDAGTSDDLKQFYGAFTGRGYAWVNSLPMLKDTLLIGKGPGNFAFYFKQFDYVGMLATHENVKQVIDKPHNAYLQYAINVGVPAAIAFFGIFVGSLIKSTKLFWKNKKNMIESNIFHIPAMVSLVGFLIYSIINDSMITVTPIVCMIAGALLASCYMMENKK